MLLQSLVLLCAASAAVRLGGLRAGAALLGSRTRAAGDRDRIAEARAVAAMVALAARHTPFRAKCLPRSLALQWLLARRGIDAELRIGVRKNGHALEAHAWIEHCGEPLIDDVAVGQRFVPFSSR